MANGPVGLWGTGRTDHIKDYKPVFSVQPSKSSGDFHTACVLRTGEKLAQP